ncbi:Protein kinase C-like phorbol ester/diacylglycerol-binding domain [Arabidopsis thaliana x Arabidopsis arenosa]|uniref:Protein kinase C-like phorbol ester/diacylglycerol-binding domain n=1 Tax=Arabidopsis thaliana x Arabidopsis arenosa TaxID=1240361 RepID=A0A8T1Z2W0_9BRAS|nr:Protein kinase C-like phorbol ester/diacylglycerol-binding domain [Arabidopsis thaliana x Arabidopsis arenosa]
MESEGVSLPLIHEHPMTPWNDLRKGDCCGCLEAISDGYYCKICDFFVHKKCGDSSEYIDHPSHSFHNLQLLRVTDFQRLCDDYCKLCGKNITNLCYHCKICDFNVDLYCARYPPPEVIDISETHHHKLTLLKVRMRFECDAAKCRNIGLIGFSYECLECNNLAFHVDCVWNPSEAKHPSEVNHPYHTLHPLKLHTGQPPDYSDGKCRICSRKIDDGFFYHCSACNFSLDLHCVLYPPRKSVRDLKVHAHQLIFRPRLDSFTCNACGLSGDRSPYICVHCDFMIHQECLILPRIININRHDHRVSRTSVLGVVNSVCGVCRQKVDWTWGGYSCLRCPGYVVHSKCATRTDVWNGEELEGVPEEIEDIEPYVVIDENTIQHFSHEEHYLRFHVNGLLCEENKRCSACTHPICLQSFYGCIDCEFTLHQNCAESPRKKWHVLHNDRLTLEIWKSHNFICDACHRISNGFMYKCGFMELDVLCGSVSEPFVHPSHSHHPLYCIPSVEKKECNGCNNSASHVLTCIESGCGFVLCFNCATLPQVVKHRVDDHPLSLCYGEKASGKYWCDICEKETDPSTWFYTCKDDRASLHTKCVLGNFAGLMPRGKIYFAKKSYEVVLNNSISRPFCRATLFSGVDDVAVKRLAISSGLSEVEFKNENNIQWQRSKTLFASPPSCSSSYWFQPRYQRLKGKHVSFLEENVLWIRVNLQNATNVAKQRLVNKFVENANKRAPNYIVIVAAKYLFLIRT